MKRQVNTSYGSATTVDTNIVEHVLDIRVKTRKREFLYLFRIEVKDLIGFFHS